MARGGPRRLRWSGLAEGGRCCRLGCPRGSRTRAAAGAALRAGVLRTAWWYRVSACLAGCVYVSACARWSLCVTLCCVRLSFVMHEEREGGFEAGGGGHEIGLHVLCLTWSMACAWRTHVMKRDDQCADKAAVMKCELCCQHAASRTGCWRCHTAVCCRQCEDVNR